MPFDPEAVRDFERAGWNRAAAAYEASFAAATRPFIPALLDAAAMGTGQDVLDLCCGPGFAGAGTARMAALLESQPAAAMPAILDAIETAAMPWRDAEGLAIPIACVIAAGTRR